MAHIRPPHESGHTPNRLRPKPCCYPKCKRTAVVHAVDNNFVCSVHGTTEAGIFASDQYKRVACQEIQHGKQPPAVSGQSHRIGETVAVIDLNAINIGQCWRT